MKQLQGGLNGLSLDCESHISVHLVLEVGKFDLLAIEFRVLFILSLWILKQESGVQIKHEGAINVGWLLVK